MTCKEAFAKAFDEALPQSGGEHSFTPCKDAFAQALDELGYAEDANPFKAAVGKIKGMFGKANQAAANKPPSPAMQGPYAGFTPPGMTKTLSQHQEEGCTAQKPENCPYNKALANQIAQQEGIDPAQAMQKAIGIHNGGGATPESQLGGAAATIAVNLNDPTAAAQEIAQDPAKVDALPEGVPGEEKEIVTKAGEINVESPTQEAVVRALNEKAMNGDADAQKALEGLKALGEIGNGESGAEQPPAEGAEEPPKEGGETEPPPDTANAEPPKPNEEPPKEGDQPPPAGAENGTEKPAEEPPKPRPQPLEEGMGNEEKLGDTTYVDISKMPFWQSLGAAWRAGKEGKSIVTEYMKVTGKWDEIKGSAERNSLRSGIAASWDYAEMDKYMANGEVSDDAKSDLQFIREEMEEAKTAAQRFAAHKKFQEWKQANGISKGGNDFGEVDKEFVEKTEKKYAGVPPKTDIYEEVSEEEKDTTFMDEKQAQIEKRLKDAGIDAEITNAINGSSVVQFEIKRADDNTSGALEKALKDMQTDIGVKITYEPDTTSGRERMGTIRINNPKVRDAGLRRLLEDEEATKAAQKMSAPFLAGETAEGRALWVDLSEHGFMGGDSGAGKSERVRSGLAGAYHIKTPNQLQVLVNAHANSADYEHLEGDPHTASVAKSVEDVEKNLKNAAAEWKRRQKLFAESGCKNLKEFNQKMADAGTPEKQLPQLVVVTDEVTNLLSQRKDLEDVIRDIVTNGRKFGVAHFGCTQDMRATNMATDIKGAQRLGVHSENKKASDMVFDVHSNEINNVEAKGGLLAKVNGQIVRLRGTYAGDENLQRLKDYNVKTYQEGTPTPPSESGAKPSEGGKENPEGGGAPSEPEKPAEGGSKPDEGGEKPSETDPFDDLVSEESKGKYEQEQVEKRTAEAEEWRNQKLDEIKNSNLSWDDRKKAVDAAKKEYAARLEAAKKGQSYEPPSEKPKEGEKGKEGEEPELTASQAEIKKEFDNEMQRELAAAEKLKLRDKIKEKERIKAKYAKVDADIKNGKSMTEILDRIDKEEQEEADKKAAAEKAKSDAEQAKADKEKADKEKAKADEAKKAEATKAKEKSKADYTSLKDKAINDLKKQIGKNGYTESDYQKDKLALEEKHSKRLADLEAGKSEKDIYERETAEQAEVDKKNEALRNTVRTEWKGKPVAGAKAHVGRGKFVPLDPKEEKEYSSLIPKGWKLDGDKTGAGVAYARNPVDGSYGFINPKTKTFTKMVDTSHPKYKGVDSKEAKEAKEALKNATAKNHAELEKTYNNVAYGHDEALPARAFLLSGIAAYLATIR